MRTFWHLILERLVRAGCLITTVALAASSFAEPIEGVDYVPGRILIKARATASDDNVDRAMRLHGLTFGKLRHSKLWVADSRGRGFHQILETLRKDPSIEYAEPDGLARTSFAANDPLITSGSAWHLERVQAPFAWDFTTGGSITVAVLDTGVQATHPDLGTKVLPGYDFVNDDADASDDFGHGTAVAGVLAASCNNMTGAAGVAPGASIFPIKVADSAGFAAYSTIAEGIRYAARNGARIINISIAGTLPSSTLQEAVDEARSLGVIIIAASGNNGSSIPLYPASCTGVISVGATTQDDSLASFSNYGATLQLTAPGDGIWTTQIETYRPYAAWRGTSFASPIVAGAAALALSLRPTLSGAETEELLRASTEDLGAPGWDPQFGWGRISAGKMASTLLNIALVEEEPSAATDTNAPVIRIVSGPANRARVEASTATFTGTARDDMTLASIEAVVGGSSFKTSPAADWSITVPLDPGTNVISFRAVDASGNASRELRRSVFRSVKTVLAVHTSEGGRLVPDLHGAELEIGRSYTVRAIASPGFILSTWGNGPAVSRVLRFVMQEGLVLEPQFITNPFPAVKGTFAGLVAREEGVTTESSGYFLLTLRGSGSYTGFLVQGGKRSSFSGRFLSDGSTQARIRRAGLPVLNASLRVDLRGNGLEGTLTDGAWTASATAHRNEYNARTNPAPQSGKREFLLVSGTGVQSPLSAAAQGEGKIALSGATIVKGRLADGRPFARGSILDPVGNYPFFVSMNRGQEIVIGWLNFPADQAGGASGEVLWVSSGTNSFATALQVTSN